MKPVLTSRFLVHHAPEYVAAVAVLTQLVHRDVGDRGLESGLGVGLATDLNQGIRRGERTATAAAAHSAQSAHSAARIRGQRELRRRAVLRLRVGGLRRQRIAAGLVVCHAAEGKTVVP